MPDLTVNVRALSQHDAAEYRRELIHAQRNPGLEFDQTGDEGEADRQLYAAKQQEVEAYLLTFDEKI
jgi:hypothetical protein